MTRTEVLAALRRVQAVLVEAERTGLWSAEVERAVEIATELGESVERKRSSSATTAALRRLAAEPELVVYDPEPGERVPVSLDVARALLLKAADWLDANRDLEVTR